MADDEWLSFTKALRPFLSTHTDDRIIFMLLRRYKATSNYFRRPNGEGALIFTKTLADIRARPSRIYAALVELKRKLKSAAAGDFQTSSENISNIVQEPVSLQSPLCCEPPSAQNTLAISTSPILNASIERPSTLSARRRVFFTSEPLSTAPSRPQPSLSLEAPISIPSTSQNRFAVQSLEHKLEFLSSRIRILEEKEMSLDDLNEEESAYVQLDRFKREHLATWRKICKLRKSSPNVGWLSSCKRFVYNGNRFDAVNRGVEKLVMNNNRGTYFPDYADIRRVVKDAVHANQNEEDAKIQGTKATSMGPTAIDRMARDVFIEVGQLLKERRQKEFRLDFGSHLTDQARTADDPASHNNELLLRLQSNRKISSNNFEEVLTKYSRLQEQQMSDGVVPSSISTFVPGVDDEECSSSSNEEGLESSDMDISIESTSSTAPHVSYPVASSGSLACINETESGSTRQPEPRDEALRIPALSASFSRVAAAVARQIAADKLVVVISDDDDEEADDDFHRPDVVDLDSPIKERENQVQKIFKLKKNQRRLLPEELDLLSQQNSVVRKHKEGLNNDPKRLKKETIQTLPLPPTELEQTDIDKKDEHLTSVENRCEQERNLIDQPVSVGQKEVGLIGPLLPWEEDGSERNAVGDKCYPLIGPFLPIENEEKKDTIENEIFDKQITKSPLSIDIQSTSIQSVMCVEENLRKRKGVELEENVNEDEEEKKRQASKRFRPDQQSYKSSDGVESSLEKALITQTVDKNLDAQEKSESKEEGLKDSLESKEFCDLVDDESEKEKQDLPESNFIEEAENNATPSNKITPSSTTKADKEKLKSATSKHPTSSFNHPTADIINLDSDDENKDDDDDPVVVGCSWSTNNGQVNPPTRFQPSPQVFCFPRSSIANGSSLIISAEQRVSFASAGTDQFGRPQMQFNIQQQQRRQVTFPNYHPSVFPPYNHF